MSHKWNSLVLQFKAVLNALKNADWMAYSVVPDQTAPSGAV